MNTAHVLGCEWCKCSCVSMQQVLLPHFLHRKPLNPSTPKCIEILLWVLSLKCWWLCDICTPCHISKFRNVKTLISVTPVHILSFLKILCSELTNWVGMFMFASPPFCINYAQKLPLLFIRVTVHDLSSIYFFSVGGAIVENTGAICHLWPSECVCFGCSWVFTSNLNRSWPSWWD